MGQASVQPAVGPAFIQPQVQPTWPRQERPSFYDERDAAGIRYRAAFPQYVMPIKAAMVGWEVRSGADPDVVDMDIVETADLTPYNESTGPRDPGNGFRWIENRWLQGRGVIVIPPADWRPGMDPFQDAADLMRATTGNVRVIATERAADLMQFAATSSPGSGFVLYDPRNGWEGAATDPSGNGTASKWPSWAVPVLGGVVVLGIGVGFMASRKRRR